LPAISARRTASRIIAIRIVAGIAASRILFAAITKGLRTDGGEPRPLGFVVLQPTAEIDLLARVLLSVFDPTGFEKMFGKGTTGKLPVYRGRFRKRKIKHAKPFAAAVAA
jgi:hypothetical protein